MLLGIWHLRYDIGPYMCVSIIIYEAKVFYIPFHTDRASSGLEGIMSFGWMSSKY